MITIHTPNLSICHQNKSQVCISITLAKISYRFDQNKNPVLAEF